MDFDPMQSRLEPRPFVGNARQRCPMPPQPDQVRYPTYEFAILPGRRLFPGVWNRVEILQ